MDYKVRIKNVSKAFEIMTKKRNRLLSLFTGGSSKNVKPYFALKDISFDVEAGDTVGILGLNGSGKSTFTDLLAGVTQPTSGTIEVNGVPSLIAIGTGLEQDLTGVENIRYKCLMHGLSPEKIDSIFDEIVEYSELGDFIHQPLRMYSSGMRSKLGFAIAIHTGTDLLIIDEALSVGDKTFSDKSSESIKEFTQQGKTVFFVSHAPGALKKMCNKGIWLHFGEMRAAGDIEEVSAQYEAFIEGYNQLSKEEQLEYRDKMSESQFGEAGDVSKTREKMSVRTILTSFLFFMFTILVIVYHTWVVI